MNFPIGKKGFIDLQVKLQETSPKLPPRDVEARKIDQQHISFYCRQLI